MPTGNTYHYTPGDIARYHRGEMNAAERHALEKAALDDPFLADALEGYQYSTHPESEAADLRAQLAARVGETKTIPMQSRARRVFTPLRVAAVVIVLLASALLAREFLVNKQEKDIAAAESNEVDSASGNTIPGRVTEPAQADSTTNDAPGNLAANKDAASGVNDRPVTSPSRIPPAATEKGEQQPSYDGAAAKVRQSEPAITPGNTDVKRNDYSTRTVAADEEKQLATRAKAEPQSTTKERAAELNTFRGKVTDEQNRGLPFANVTNTRDNVGTYTDVSGNFVLTSPDSVLNVQVRSLGYDDNLEMLRNHTNFNRIVMQPDNAVQETVISRSNSNALRRSTETMKVEEPEPADGWENYDVYLSNNLNIPSDFKPRPALPREVELSFEVNRQGEPVNIRVERSLCASCDREAIRLVSEGPRWKRNRGKRTRVTINF